LTHPEIAGSPSTIFGDRFSYPFDGKTVLFEIANQFAQEFNEGAQKYLEQISSDRALAWTPMSVTSAYPTSRQNCPRIAIIRTGSTPKMVGLGSEIETRRINSPSGDQVYRAYRGQTVTDSIEVSLCCLNERMRDDVFIWFQQYLIDAIAWLLPQLASMGGVTDLRCTNAVDDQVEYQGSAAQPGFQFYIARLDCIVQYDLMVINDVDTLKQVFNWAAIV
jgi:hypothetical protein